MSNLLDSYNQFSETGVGQAANAAGGYLASAPFGIGMVAGPLFGSLRNAAAVRAKKQEISGYEGEVDDWYKQNINQNYLETNVGRSVVEQARKELEKRNRIAENQNVVTGGTAEAGLAAKTINQEQYSDVLSRLSAMGTAREDQIESRYRSQKMPLLGMKLGEHDADIASAQQFQENAAEQTQMYLRLASMLAGGV
jgi:hypothetical protein